MTESKHTAGPWIQNNGLLGPLTVMASGRKIARIYDRNLVQSYPNEAKANACLIAAAPELLKVCERALPWLGRACAENIHTDCALPQDLPACIEQMTAIIAKAKGE